MTVRQAWHRSGIVSPTQPICAITSVPVVIVADCVEHVLDSVLMHGVTLAVHWTSMSHLVFLTRAACVNTIPMRENLDRALKTLGLPGDYPFIDADTLAASDPRGGYGTPTILYDNRDLFGLAEPPIPHPPAT